MSLQGLAELSQTLIDIGDKAAKKAAKAGVNAGLGVLAKEIKDQVNAMGVSGELKAAIRKTVGKRLLKKEGDEYAGKAGFSVGTQSESKQRKAKARSQRGQKGSREKRGVGISAANVHWLLGTKDRRTESGRRGGVSTRPWPNRSTPCGRVRLPTTAVSWNAAN